MPFAAGSRVGPYELLQQIGRGGMGIVFRARDTRLDREVALKCISIESFESGSTPHPSTHTGSSSRAAGARERFLREARAVSALNHPNICTIYDIGEENGQPYLVMELLHGQTLRQLLTHGKLAVADTLRFTLETSSALMAAHAQGIIHRDIKPANLFIVETGHGPRHVKILDFGLAKRHGDLHLSDSSSSDETMTAAAADPLTSEGSAIGTVAYMSPEQARSEQLDPRTDVFSLGCVAYQMATGVTPFRGGSTAEIFVALLTKEPAAPSTLNPDLPAGFDTLIARMLAKDRDVRYPSSAAVHEDVERLIETGKVRPADRAHFGTRRAGAYLGMAAVLLVLLGLAGGYVLHRDAQRKSDSAATPPSTPATPNGPAAPAQTSSIFIMDFDNTTHDPVFDTTLREALAVQLEQSPALRLVSLQHMQQSLQYIGKPTDTPLTLELAREIATREGIKAILTGSISQIGSDYDISVQAINSATGDVIGREQTEVKTKEAVLAAVSKVATGLREKLGESLDSIKKLNTPLGLATTASLEAFRAYALGEQAHQRGHETESLGYYRQAVEMDPKFAMAYARMGVIYTTMGAAEKATANITRAYKLSDTVSAREKLYIRSRYFSDALGDIPKTIDALKLYSNFYPDDSVATNNLSVAYLTIGKFAEAQQYAQKTIQADPNRGAAYANLMNALLGQDQFAQAEQVYQQNHQRFGPFVSLDSAHMVASFLLGNTAAIMQQIQASSGNEDAFIIIITAAWLAEAQGDMQQAGIYWQQGVDLASGGKLQDAAGPMLAYMASDFALTGDCSNVRDNTARATRMDNERVTTYSSALALALCKQPTSQPLLKKLTRTWPEDTLVQHVFVPSITAALALESSNPQDAIKALDGQEAYDLVSLAPYLRGLAYLQLNQPLQAVTQFSIVRAHRGAFIAGGILSQYASTTLAYPLAELGIARAYARQGNSILARGAYQTFLDEWKNGDQNSQPVLDARKELAALK